MANVDFTEQISNFRSATYGKDVRESLIDVAEAVEDAVNNQLVTVDATLQESGQGADAAIVGQKIAELKDDLSDISLSVLGDVSRNYTEGKNFSSTGVEIDDALSCISEYIPVTWPFSSSDRVGFRYTDDDTDTNSYRMVLYDSDKNYILNYGRNAAPTKTRSVLGADGTAYVRISFKKGSIGTVFNGANIVYWEAEETTSQEGLVSSVGDVDELETDDKSNIVNAINEVNSKVQTDILPIKVNDTDFFYTSPNLADPSTFVVGEFVNQTNGVFTANTAQTRTDYIAIKAQKTYCIVNNADFDATIRYAFYNSNKEFITGAYTELSAIGNLVTAPSNASYMVMSGTSMRFPFMVAESDTKITYVEYSEAYLLPQYILGEDISNLPINLPSKIYALAGYELNIYFENIVEDWTQYNFDVSCSKGMQLERGYRITPVNSDAGSYPLNITVSTKDGNSRKTVSTTLIVTSANAGNGTTKSVIILGDSTTNNGAVIEKLNENFADDVMSVVTLGTRGTAPNNHEGRSGWTLNNYFNTESADYTDGRGHVENPFYNPTTETFDASYYFANSGVAQPNWFIINMGINDMFSCTADSALASQINTCLGYLHTMVTSIKGVSSNIKIGICVTIPPNHSQDAFGKAYACGQTRNRYKRNNALWAKAIIFEFDDDADVYVIPIHTNLDTVYNMGMETLNVNARNTAITYESPIANGGVHPVESGYWQIADVYAAFLKANA